MRVKFFFALYDFWIGVFWDRKNKILYICPLPCCVFKIQSKNQPSPRRDWLIRHSIGNALAKLHAIDEITSDLYDNLYTISKEISK